MFSLLHGLYEYISRKEEYRVIILGLDNAGKTTLLERIKAVYTGAQPLPPDRIAPTIGLNIGKVQAGKHRLHLWDLGGQSDLQALWAKYYADCHAVIFVVDATDEPRIEEVKNVFRKIITDEEIEGVPVLMLANKTDNEHALRLEQVKEHFNQIAQHLGARDSRVLAVSALQGIGVREAVDWVCLRMERNKVNRMPLYT